MKNEPMVNGIAGRMAKKKDMPPIAGAVDETRPNRVKGIYPEDEEMTNALWLVELMIHKTRR